MNYHNIVHDDMRNGVGLRVTLFVSGCEHYCDECQNPQTWNAYSGIEFDDNAKQEIFDQLSHDYIDGITLSGGDPLYKSNLGKIYSLLQEIKAKFPKKTIWIYTGYTLDEIHEDACHDCCSAEAFLRQQITLIADVLVDGVFDKNLADIHYHWAGSTNQRIIDMKQTIKEKQIVIYKDR